MQHEFHTKFFFVLPADHSANQCLAPQFGQIWSISPRSNGVTRIRRDIWAAGSNGDRTVSLDCMFCCLIAYLALPRSWKRCLLLIITMIYLVMLIFLFIYTTCITCSTLRMKVLYTTAWTDFGNRFVVCRIHLSVQLLIILYVKFFITQSI